MELAFQPFERLPGGLPSEIWHYILDILDRADHSSLKAVVLCSSGMYKMAASILFMTLYLECDGSGSDRMWERRMRPTRLCAYVENIIVVHPRGQFWGFRWTHFPHAFLECLYHLFKVAENLQNVCWWHEKYMPGEILYQLYRYCPQASVHIASSKIALCERINQKHTSSPQLSCVRSIEAEWCDGEYDGPIKPNAKGHFPAQLRDIICRCQNLESLALISKRKFRPRLRDISSDLERKEAEAKLNVRGLITLKQGDILPQVKNLHFRRMRFGPAQSTLWATQLRWQNIKHLSLIEISWVHLLPKITTKGCFHSLEALEMSIPNLASSYGQDRSASVECINQLHAFLKELPPLKMFIGYGFPQDTLAVLAKYHSKSLNHLRFRYELSSNLDAGTTSWEQPSFRASIHNLDNLFNQFPNLHSLGLNVDWTSNEELPYDLLADIVLQHRIQHLELNLPDLHRHDSESWPYPNVDEDTCQALVQSLDKISVNLLSLHVAIGNWFPFSPQPILPWALEAYLIGERDYVGCMRFRKIRQFTQRGRLMREGNFVPRVPSHLMKGVWPNDLRQDIESRISDLFCGKMLSNPLANSC
ncbi:hypothetical protein DTO021C3_7000 [Paecilomyces variotii]|nr:hypothetical protein DTO195F2_1363 [Paecilomyces variotii]KAJ9285476.1 hypothetical protein DTO021C3_7000 [Paecilomyces variotii]KAJ9307474.1 hypothetical protein DTO217A2_2946 [Paecilomyces variotii]